MREVQRTKYVVVCKLERLNQGIVQTFQQLIRLRFWQQNKLKNEKNQFTHHRNTCLSWRAVWSSTSSCSRRLLSSAPASWAPLFKIDLFLYQIWTRRFKWATRCVFLGLSVTIRFGHWQRIFPLGFISKESFDLPETQIRDNRKSKSCHLSPNPLGLERRWKGRIFFLRFSNWELT